MRKRVHFEQILESIPLLQSMSHYERTVLADAFEEQFFAAGSEIIHEGDSADEGYFYILTEGECSATQLDTDNASHEVRHYTEGGYFGELALLHGHERRATVHAVTDCKCILLDKFSFERLLGPVKEILARDAQNYDNHL